jgi:glutamyl-Q tRNA(Asp) synthetase
MDSCVGRFAPSPTGDLHVGSLVAAIGSYLEARRQGGGWRLRIEDIDTPRNVPGAADRIVGTLRRLGFKWDGEIDLQSRHRAAHDLALAALDRAGYLFACACTRRTLAAAGADDGGCAAGCRARRLPHEGNALRFSMPEDGRALRWFDRLQGPQQAEPAMFRDVVVRRRDGLVAYQLAVVVDDAALGVTEVVRGADLLDSTPWQRGLQRVLGLPTPQYAHLPLVVEPDGSKLAKSRRSLPIAGLAPAAALGTAMTLLRHTPPPDHAQWPTARFWSWATEHWDPTRLQGLREVRLGV